MKSHLSFWLRLSLGLAVAAAGCGGGGGGAGGPSTTSSSVTSVIPVGNAIPLETNAIWSAQYLNGSRIVCGVFSGQPGAYINNNFKPLPETITGGTKYVPSFMAGKIIYGTYSGGNFSWNTLNGSVADTGQKKAVAVSANGDYVAFQTAGTGSVLHVQTNTEVGLPVAAISAVSDSGSGVCQIVADSSSYRFSASGNIPRTPLLSASGSQNYTIQASNINGLLTGESGGLPYIWQPNSQRPTPLGIPGGSSGYAISMNDGGAVGGWYQSSGTSGGFAVLWPEGSRAPNVFVDINGQFPLTGGGVLNGIYALDPNSLNFTGVVTNSDGSQSIQAFVVN